MSKSLTIREATSADRNAIRKVEEAAFGQADEAALVEALIAAGSDVLELVAEENGSIIGHILFSRLMIARSDSNWPDSNWSDSNFSAVALAPLAVLPAMQRRGIGAALIEKAHRRLQEQGERLSVVLGEPAYYGRFLYTHARASGFTSDYQGKALQALSWGAAPATGQLVYASAFSGL